MSDERLGELQAMLSESLLKARGQRREIARRVSLGVTDPTHLAYQDGVVEALESSLAITARFVRAVEQPLEPDRDFVWSIQDHLGTERGSAVGASPEAAIRSYARNLDLDPAALGHWQAVRLYESSGTIRGDDGI